jgi:hypothetical protein
MAKNLQHLLKRFFMKKIIVLMAGFVFLVSCSNNDGQTGVMNDGMSAGDTNGGLADTAFGAGAPVTDSSKREHRVDLSKRDTFDNPPR